MLKVSVRSRNVYENKGNMDIMPNKETDIYVDMTRVLQKPAALYSAFASADWDYAVSAR
jgi:hypothetical protein